MNPFHQIVPEFENTGAALRLNIVAHGCARLDQRWADVSIRPPYSRLYYMIDGEGEVIVEKQKIKLHGGKVYLFPAGTTIAYRCPKSMTQLYFHLETRTADGYDLFTRTHQPVELPVETDASQLTADYLSGGYLPEMRVRSRVETDVARCIAASRLEETLLHQPSAFLQAVFRTVQKQLRSSLTIAEIARELSLSESSLTKRFRREFGTPLGRYMDEILAQEIARRLLQSDESIQAIAEELGFCDPFYLSRFFRAHRELSPREYRLRMKAQI